MKVRDRRIWDAEIEPRTGGYFGAHDGSSHYIPKEHAEILEEPEAVPAVSSRDQVSNWTCERCGKVVSRMDHDCKPDPLKALADARENKRKADQCGNARDRRGLLSNAIWEHETFIRGMADVMETIIVYAVAGEVEKAIVENVKLDDKNVAITKAREFIKAIRGKSNGAYKKRPE